MDSDLIPSVALTLTPRSAPCVMQRGERALRCRRRGGCLPPLLSPEAPQRGCSHPFAPSPPLQGLTLTSLPGFTPEVAGMGLKRRWERAMGLFLRDFLPLSVPCDLPSRLPQAQNPKQALAPRLPRQKLFVIRLNNFFPSFPPLLCLRAVFGAVAMRRGGGERGGMVPAVAMDTV